MLNLAHRRHDKLQRACRLALSTAFLTTPLTLKAEIAEEAPQFATDAIAPNLFPLNPATVQAGALQGAVMLQRNERKASFNQDANAGDTITSIASDDFLTAGANVDLGAGAGLGLTHSVDYHKVDTAFSSEKGDPHREFAKQQHTAIKIAVELTDELKAGLAIRYLFKDVSILGSPSLADGEKTRYKTTMVGYGSGFAYYYEHMAGLSYTYFPPLRGKSDIYGEEKIVVEPGFITIDSFYIPNANWHLGVGGKRWLQEIDDRASGTTAADDQTNISLYGLDLDQYVFPKQLLMVGADYLFSKETYLKVSLGQEQDELNFKDLRQFSRLDVTQRQNEANHVMKYYRARIMLRHSSGKYDAEVSAGFFERAETLPDAMNGGVYKSSGRELEAALGIKL